MYYSKDDRITVRIWKSEETGTASGTRCGHVSIESGFGYISIWPVVFDGSEQDPNRVWAHHCAGYQNSETDKPSGDYATEERLPEAVICLYNGRTDLMEDKRLELYKKSASASQLDEKADTIKFATDWVPVQKKDCPVSSEPCSSIAFQFLMAGCVFTSWPDTGSFGYTPHPHPSSMDELIGMIEKTKGYELEKCPDTAAPELGLDTYQHLYATDGKEVARRYLYHYMQYELPLDKRAEALRYIHGEPRVEYRRRSEKTISHPSPIQLTPEQRATALEVYHDAIRLVDYKKERRTKRLQKRVALGVTFGSLFILAPIVWPIYGLIRLLTREKMARHDVSVETYQHYKQHKKRKDISTAPIEDLVGTKTRKKTFLWKRRGYFQLMGPAHTSSDQQDSPSTLKAKLIKKREPFPEGENVGRNKIRFIGAKDEIKQFKEKVSTAIKSPRP